MINPSEFPILKNTINKNFDVLNMKANSILEGLKQPITLYRVGIPRITETTNRFTCGRDTGGIGTGIYAYRSLSSAKKDSNYIKGEQKIYLLEAKKGFILYPLSENESLHLNNLGKYMRCKDCSNIKFHVLYGFYPSLEKRYDLVYGNLHKKEYDVRRELLKMIGLAIRESEECAVKNVVKRIIIDDKDYTNIIGNRKCSQPINYLFNYFDIEAVIPHGHLADSNWMGSVILKETIDKKIGRITEGYENIPELTLNKIE